MKENKEILELIEKNTRVSKLLTNGSIMIVIGSFFAGLAIHYWVSRPNVLPVFVGLACLSLVAGGCVFLAGLLK